MRHAVIMFFSPKAPFRGVLTGFGTGRPFALLGQSASPIEDGRREMLQLIHECSACHARHAQVAAWGPPLLTGSGKPTVHFDLASNQNHDNDTPTRVVVEASTDFRFRMTSEELLMINGRRLQKRHALVKTMCCTVGDVRIGPGDLGHRPAVFG